MGRQSQYETKKQGVLDAIASLTTTSGKPPSFREISEQTGVSVATLHSYLRRLQQEGLIEWTERSHRSLRLTRQGSEPTNSSSEKTSAAPDLPQAPPVPPSPTIEVDQSLEVGF